MAQKHTRGRESLITRRECACWDAELNTEHSPFVSLQLGESRHAAPAPAGLCTPRGGRLLSSYPCLLPVCGCAILSHGALINTKDRICAIDWRSFVAEAFFSFPLSPRWLLFPPGITPGLPPSFPPSLPVLAPPSEQAGGGVGILRKRPILGSGASPEEGSPPVLGP